jgi:hypothetical protein
LFQNELCPVIPTVKNNKEFNAYRLLLERMDSILCEGGDTLRMGNSLRWEECIPHPEDFRGFSAKFPLSWGESAFSVPKAAAETEKDSNLRDQT